MFGKLVKVNLTTGEIKKDTVPQDWVCDYIGGSGLAARMLWDVLDISLDPLDPANPLLFITGPLTGTGGPTTGRFTICGRSPQTGWWGEANIGGFVGPEMRKAGVDILWVEGKSSEPVYLYITDGGVEIHPAGHLWGHTDTYETQTAIREELGEPRVKVACIGLAGENLVPCSVILSDHGRVAARTGMGTLMGSKSLKALAVMGNGKIPLEIEGEYRKLRLESNQNLLEQNMTSILRATGTSGSADYFQILGDMPQKYWTQATFEGAADVSGAVMAETILTDARACQGCVIACGREVEIKEGVYPTRGKSKGPEYEMVCSFGPQLLVNDLTVITALGDKCDRLGMDVITAGNTIALLYLLSERGLATPADTGGYTLKWGDAIPCFSLLEQMAKREGSGKLLAMGSKALAAHFGDADLAVQANGLDFAMHDPRAFSGQAVAYVTSPRGACHNQSDFFQVELGGTMESIGIPMVDRFTDQGKAAYVARHQHWRTVCNSLTLCFFAVVEPVEVLALLNAAVGLQYDLERMMKAGERAWNMKRIYNLRLGWKPENEKLPKLLLQPLPDGGQEGHVPDMAVLLNEYYAASGWDRQTGWPNQSKLVELGLEFTATM